MEPDWDFIENIAARIAQRLALPYDLVLARLKDACENGEINTFKMDMKDLAKQNRDEN